MRLTDFLNRTRSGEASVTKIDASTDPVVLYDGSVNNLEGILIANDSDSDLFIKFGTEPTTDSYSIKLPAGALYESPGLNVYTGVITGFWTSADGKALVTTLEK